MSISMKHLELHPGQGWRLAMWAIIATLLLLPLVAMQFTSEVQWTAFDFAVAAALLIGGGAAYEIAARTLTSPTHRLIAGAVLLSGIALIWIDGAVGIF